MIRPVRALPGYAWLGLVLMAVSQAGMLAGIEPFASWHTPIAWTGYILLIDGLVWKRRGSCWIRDSPAEFLFLAAVSVPLWLIFEFYNKFALRNWHYIGLPESLLIRYAGYAWSFATIWPGIFETSELAGTFRGKPTGPVAVPARPFSWGAAASVAAGALMLLFPLLYPSPYLAAPVFLGFIFLLDPLNARAGADSIVGDWRAGQRGRLANLLIGGLVCGFVWEFWNYWARAKWIYTVPILPEVKIFEMPVLGFAGFPPFAVECFVMYVAVRRMFWSGRSRPIAL